MTTIFNDPVLSWIRILMMGIIVFTMAAEVVAVVEVFVYYPIEAWSQGHVYTSTTWLFNLNKFGWFYLLSLVSGGVILYLLYNVPKHLKYFMR